MKKTIFYIAVLLGVTASLLSFKLPTDWFVAGDQPKSYEMGIDEGAGKDGSHAATIKSIDKKIDGFGTLMQNALPGKYLGKRVRMTGIMKSKDISEWAGFWLRIDGKETKRSLSFDNMHDGKKDRSVKGTTDWAKYEIVLDVPKEASNMAYGALLSGTGQIWFDDIQFEIVDTSVATTGKDKTECSDKKEPSNLNFEN